MENTHVVVDDPEGIYYVGSLVDASRARQLSTRGVTVLPFAAPMMKLSGAGGYVLRSWGAGWPLDDLHPAMTSQLLLYVDPSCRVLHWRARVSPAENAPWLTDGTVPQGSLRIAADSSQRAPNAARLVPQDSPVDVSRLGRPDSRGGWIVGGKASVACGVAGHLGLAIYGGAPGMRLLWAAVSTTER